MKRRGATRAPTSATASSRANGSRKRAHGATAAPATKKSKAKESELPADDDNSETCEKEPVYKHDKFFGGGYWYNNGTFVSTKAAKAAAKAGARASTNEWDATKALCAFVAAKTGTSRAGASKAVPKAGTAAQAALGSTVRGGTHAAGKASSKASSNKTTSGARCSGKCRLARPCPTEKNKTGRGACGNAGCADHGAIYGCKTCGIRLCSFECINAHLFEGRAIKAGLSRLKADEYHPWYQGESA